MPSFLSKVFGRKKDDDGNTFPSPRSPRADRVSDSSFEAVTPSAVAFPQVENGRGDDGEKGRQQQPLGGPFQNLFSKSKSRPSSPEPQQRRAPHLSLHFSASSDLRDEAVSRALALGVVWEGDDDADDVILLSDKVIGERRLTPTEALNLVHACSQAIIDRGLETLGIMHPHWHSASPEIQRKLISLFLQSLAVKSPVAPSFSPEPVAFLNAFESEITSTRSPHDVAAVLRWGIRHLQVEGSSFGNEERWYKMFFDGERSSEYPTNAYSTILAPQLPASHLQLLNVTLELVSYLAAHAEANGISGSKLSKFLGLWLLTSERARAADDWSTFYSRWDQTGRMLEHLFLARIRDEASGARLPIRLIELVKQYPYYTNKTTPPSPHLDLLPRPRFSSAQYDALFVHIETVLPPSAAVPKHHPVSILVDAFKADTVAAAASTAYAGLWERIRKAGNDEGAALSPGGCSGVGRVFSEDTVRFLSLLPVELEKGEVYSNPFVRASPVRGRSFSPTEGGGGGGAPLLPPVTAATSDHGNGSGALLSSPPPPPASKPLYDTQPLSAISIGKDWAEFSTSGFFEETSIVTPLAATLLGTEEAKDKEDKGDADVDVNSNTKKRSWHKAQPSFASSAASWRRSSETSTTTTTTTNHAKSKSSAEAHRVSEEQEERATAALVSKATVVSLTALDEAFVDFWHDALLDPVSASFPPFVICRLKAGAEVEVGVEGGKKKTKKVEWIVVERVYKRLGDAAPSGEALSSVSSRGGRKKDKEKKEKGGQSSSPRSFISDLSFGTSFKRFSFFGGSTGPSSPSSPEKTPLSASARGRKAKAKGFGKVGEMGVVLVEEEEGGKERKEAKEAKAATTVKLRIPSPKPRKSVDVPRNNLDVSARQGADLDSRKSVDRGGVGLDAAAAAAVVGAVTSAPVTSATAPETHPTNASAAVQNGAVLAAAETDGSAKEESSAPVPATEEDVKEENVRYVEAEGDETLVSAPVLDVEADAASVPPPAAEVVEPGVLESAPVEEHTAPVPASEDIVVAPAAPEAAPGVGRGIDQVEVVVEKSVVSAEEIVVAPPAEVPIIQAPATTVEEEAVVPPAAPEASVIEEGIPQAQVVDEALAAPVRAPVEETFVSHATAEASVVEEVDQAEVVVEEPAALAPAPTETSVVQEGIPQAEVVVEEPVPDPDTEFVDQEAVESPPAAEPIAPVYTPAEEGVVPLAAPETPVAEVEEGIPQQEVILEERVAPVPDPAEAAFVSSVAADTPVVEEGIPQTEAVADQPASPASAPVGGTVVPPVALVVEEGIPQAGVVVEEPVAPVPAPAEETVVPPSEPEVEGGIPHAELVVGEPAAVSASIEASVVEHGISQAEVIVDEPAARVPTPDEESVVPVVVADESVVEEGSLQAEVVTGQAAACEPEPAEPEPSVEGVPAVPVAEEEVEAETVPIPDEPASEALVHEPAAAESATPPAVDDAGDGKDDSELVVPVSTQEERVHAQAAEEDEPEIAPEAPVDTIEEAVFPTVEGEAAEAADTEDAVELPSVEAETAEPKAPSEADVTEEPTDSAPATPPERARVQVVDAVEEVAHVASPPEAGELEASGEATQPPVIIEEDITEGEPPEEDSELTLTATAAAEPEENAEPVSALPVPPVEETHVVQLVEEPAVPESESVEEEPLPETAVDLPAPEAAADAQVSTPHDEPVQSSSSGVPEHEALELEHEPVLDAVKEAEESDSAPFVEPAVEVTASGEEPEAVNQRVQVLDGDESEQDALPAPVTAELVHTTVSPATGDDTPEAPADAEGVVPEEAFAPSIPASEEEHSAPPEPEVAPIIEPEAAVEEGAVESGAVPESENVAKSKAVVEPEAAAEPEAIDPATTSEPETEPPTELGPVAGEVDTETVVEPEAVIPAAEREATAAIVEHVPPTEAETECVAAVEPDAVHEPQSAAEPATVSESEAVAEPEPTVESESVVEPQTVYEPIAAPPEESGESGATTEKVAAVEPEALSEPEATSADAQDTDEPELVAEQELGNAVESEEAPEEAIEPDVAPIPVAEPETVIEVVDDEDVAPQPEDAGEDQATVEPVKFKPTPEPVVEAATEDDVIPTSS